MKYIFDLDGTLCTNTDGRYKDAIPIKDRINKVNKLYDDGNQIIILTARGMGRYNNDVRKAYNHFYSLTKKQLCDWGIKHHDLFLGKPSGDFYIDDKGVKDEDFFNTTN